MTADHHLFWITSRAAGVTALLLASLAVSAGLLMGGRLIHGRRAQDVRALHEILSLATLGALAVHGLSLLGDSYLRPSLADIAIPFVSGYARWWTAAGIIGAWGLGVLGLSFYARRHIGTARWRSLHRSPRWPGCSVSCTRSARAATAAASGSSRWSRWRSARRWACSRRA